MPRPPLAQDHHNLRRMHMMAILHNAIYYLRHVPNRLPQVIDILKELQLTLDPAIESSLVEHDRDLHQCCHNLELVLPVVIWMLGHEGDYRKQNKDVAEDLIDCIPYSLRIPAKWDIEGSDDESEYSGPRRLLPRMRQD
jgi:hypothetical protein